MFFNTNQECGVIMKNLGSKIGLYLFEIIFIVIAVMYLYPVLQMVFTSLKDTGEVISNPLGFPHRLEFSNYVKAWDSMGFPTAFMSSMILTAGSLIFIVLLSSMAAYPLARIDNRMNKCVYIVFVSGIMLPAYTAIVPLVKLFKFLHMTNSYFGLIVFYIATVSPFAVFIYTGFLKTVPRELEESAIIDGCNEFKSYWLIIMPLMKSATASIIIVCSMWIWNDFLMPLVMIQDSWKKPLSPTINYFFEKYNVSWNYAFAGFVMTAIPVIIVFLLLQEQYIKGIAAGAVKG